MPRMAAKHVAQVATGSVVTVTPPTRCSANRGTPPTHPRAAVG